MKAPDRVVLSVPYPSEAWDEAIKQGYVVPYRPDPPMPQEIRTRPLRQRSPLKRQ
jgi:hypothetical protein